MGFEFNADEILKIAEQIEINGAKMVPLKSRKKMDKNMRNRLIRASFLNP